MFVLNRKQIINSNMSKYVKEYTNKWLLNLKEKYSNNSHIIRVYDLVKYKNEEPKLTNSFFIPFVSFILFLASYNSCKSIS